MDLFHGIFLGIIQGITEFFPVSSSGHLVFTPVLFGWEDQGLAFDTVVHGGTLVALIAVFWQDLTGGIKKAVTERKTGTTHFALRLLVATVPALIAGWFLGGIIERTLRSPMVVAASLAGWGIVLLAADHYRTKQKPTITDPRKTGWPQAIAVGIMQAVALIPGTSRSGITMTTGLFAGMDRKTAVDFSFFLSIPTVGAAFAYGIFRLAQQGALTDQIGMLTAGFLAAALTGFWAIRFLRSYVATHSFRPFVWYRLILAALIFFFLAPNAASAASIPVLNANATDPAIDLSQYASLLVIDVPSGKTLYKLEPNKPWTAASLTKLMTVEEYTRAPRNWGSLGNILAADEVGGGRLSVVAGSTLTLRDLLYSAIVGSANNAAEALARLGGAGDRAAFIARMNQTAQTIGLSNSTFNDAAGMDPTNKTTAYDMAMLINKMAEHPETQHAMVTFTYNFTVASPRLHKRIKNTNGLLYIEPDVWVTAGKTGYLEESKHNLVTTVEPSPRINTSGGELAIVVFGAPDRDTASRTTAALAKWAWANFDWSGGTAALPRNAGEGDKGADILSLQKYLNANGVRIAASGPGSPGSETTLFGPLTKAALTKFQQTHAADILAPQGRPTATGYLDYQTRAFINGAVTPSVEPVTPLPSITPPSEPDPSGISQLFSRNLALGDRGEDVIALQRWLNINGFQLASTGPGAPGQETAYFGPITQSAVRRFQQAKSTAITGILDESTRAFIVK